MIIINIIISRRAYGLYIILNKKLLSIYDVNQCGATHSADLGGSSKYSYGTYEDWSGERFREKSISTRVSRS